MENTKTYDREDLVKLSIRSWLEDLDENDCVEVWNYYAESCDYHDDEIYGMHISELLERLPYEREDLIREMLNSELNLNHTYFAFSQNIWKSFDNPFGEDSPAVWDLDDMVNFLYQGRYDPAGYDESDHETQADNWIYKIVYSYVAGLTELELHDLGIEHGVISDEDDISEADFHMIREELKTMICDSYDDFPDVQDAHLVEPVIHSKV